MKNEYSPKEMALIKHYFPDFDDETLEHLTAYPLYRIMVEEAFVNLNGDLDEDIFYKSLRNCMIALRECKIFRLTPEFDALIDDGVLT